MLLNQWLATTWVMAVLVGGVPAFMIAGYQGASFARAFLLFALCTLAGFVIMWLLLFQL